MKPTLMLLTALLLLPLTALHAANESATKPNILVILTDDHGWADFGAHGVDPHIRTPNVDQLARDGVRFSRGYVTAPQCTPSRAGLMSGRYQTKFGVEENFDPMPSEVVTLPERLKTSGYVTGMSGKWHLAAYQDANGNKLVDPALEPWHQGFDEYFSGTEQDYSASHALDGTRYPDAPRAVTEAGNRVVLQTEWALKFLERRAAEQGNTNPAPPFFLYLSYMAPHTPPAFPAPWIDQVPPELSRDRRSALALIAAIDDGVGRVRQQLNAMGQAANTLIFFLGDNGAPLGSSGDGSINLPMRGQKGMVAEGGVRVPFVAAWPGKIPGNQVFQHPVSSLDIAATAIASVGQPTAPELDGVNLLPHLTGENHEPPHQTLYWRWADQAAIQEFPYKLILLGRNQTLLFDITTPDGEHHTRELSAQEPAIAASLRAKLDAWLATLSPPGPPQLLQREGAYIASEILPEETAGMPHLYWEGAGTAQNSWEDWTTLTAWNTASDGSGSADPAAAPGESDIAVFNTSLLDAARGARIADHMSIGGLVFDNTGTTGIASLTSVMKTLTILSGGITVNPGAGAVTFGTGSRPITVALNRSQTWLNNSSALLSHANAGSTFSDLALYSYTLTIDGTGPTTFSSDAMTGSAATAVIKNGTGILTFNVKESTTSLVGRAGFTGDVRINGGTVRYGVAQALPVTADVVFNTSSGTATLDLNNLNGTIKSLTLGGAAGTVAAVTTGTGILTLDGNVTFDAANHPNRATISGLLDLGTATRTFTIGDSSAVATDLEVSALISGSVGLIKEGAGTCVLSGANSYTGETTVTGGTLAVNGSSINNSNKLTIDGGKVNLTNAETVSALFFGAVQQAAGTYSSDGAGATIPSANFTGSGTLIVSTAPVGYSAWQSANGTTQGANLDHDNDGVSNGIEFFLGGTGNTTGLTTPLPGVDPATLSVTWLRHPDFPGFPGNYGTDFYVETSATLTDPWTLETVPGNVTITGNNVKYTFPADTKNFARLKVVAP